MFTMRLKWLMVFAMLCAIPALAGPILLNNTGETNNGTTCAGSCVAITQGMVDPHWVLQPPVNYAGYVVTSGSAQFSSWLADTATSQWIGVQPSYTAGMSDNAGNWTYQTTFSLTGMLPATASITGRWLTDNTGINIYLNGTIMALTTPANDFTLWTSFSLPVGSNFVAGLNTLDFVSSNTSGPSGLRVEFLTGTATDVSAVPEPATLGLLGVGLLGLGIARRKRA